MQAPARRILFRRLGLNSKNVFVRGGPEAIPGLWLRQGVDRQRGVQPHQGRGVLRGDQAHVDAALRAVADRQVDRSFVGRDDEMVIKLLTNKSEQYDDYSLTQFVKEAELHFDILDQAPLK